ncbi:MAG: hypothetical protein ACKUBY_04270 [Candidatus Moraniibacteriota bacterium]|jgi:protein GP30.3
MKSKIGRGALFGLTGTLVIYIILVTQSGSQVLLFGYTISKWWLVPLVTVAFSLVGYDVAKKHESIDIHSHGKYPANLLSNLYQCPFYFDGVYCATREGLLQAFKTKFLNEQLWLCSLTGYEVQKTGQEYNNWKKDQILYWKGKTYKRDSEEYWDLLKRVFDLENISLDVVAALLATRNRKLIHSIGKSDITDTILTEEEFCSLMTNARSKLKEKGLAYIG